MKFLFSDRLCVLCRQHDAKFKFHGKVKRDKDHNICHRCYRSLIDRNQARLITEIHRGPLVIFELSSFFRQALEQPGLRNLGSRYDCRKNLDRSREISFDAQERTA